MHELSDINTLNEQSKLIIFNPRNIEGVFYYILEMYWWILHYIEQI